MSFGIKANETNFVMEKRRTGELYRIRVQPARDVNLKDHSEVVILWEDKESESFRIDSNILHNHSFEAGTAFYLYLAKTKDKPPVVNSAICEDEYQLLVRPQTSLFQQIVDITAFAELRQDVRTMILTKAKGDAVGSDTNRAFRLETVEEVKKMYSYTKNRFTPEVQLEIEQLIEKITGKLDGKIRKDSKHWRRLGPILETLEHSAFRKYPSYHELYTTLQDTDVFLRNRGKKRLAELLSPETNGKEFLFVGGNLEEREQLLKAVANAMGLAYRKVDVSGIRDTAVFLGAQHSYQDADLGSIMEMFFNAGTTELVFHLVGCCAENKDKNGNFVSDPLVNTLLSQRIWIDEFVSQAVNLPNTILVIDGDYTAQLPVNIRKMVSEVVELEPLTKEERIQGLEAEVRKLMKQFPDLSVCDGVTDYLATTLVAEEGFSPLKKHVYRLFVHAAREGTSVITKEVAETYFADYRRTHATEIELFYRMPFYSEATRDEIRRTMQKLKNPDLDDALILHYRHRLETFAAFGDRHHCPFDMERFQNQLNASHYGMEKVKGVVARKLYSSASTHSDFGRPFLFVGPPGTGKSTLVRSIADGLGRKFQKISLNGQFLGDCLFGSSLSTPGSIAAAVCSAGTDNIVICLDEVEKSSISVQNALFSILDPGNKVLTDKFLQAEVSLEHIFFCLTANSLDLPQALLDRCEIIQVDGYGDQEKYQMAMEHFIPVLNKQYAACNMTFVFEEETVHKLVDLCAYESGARGLKAAFDALAEHIFCQRYTGESTTITVTVQDIEQYLPDMLQYHNICSEPRLGVANALAINSYGSGLLFEVEAVPLPDNELIITGLARETVIESTKVCVTFLNNYFGKDRIPQGFHLNFCGASEKHGPSAGAAILVALISAITNTPPAISAAYTGAMTLGGTIMPVGGVAQKIDAARRAGCTTVFIPYDNYEPDMKNSGIEVVPVRQCYEIIEKVFPNLNHKGK